MEKQNNVKSGYVKLHYIYSTDNDTPIIRTEEAFFISTPKDIKYLTYRQNAYGVCLSCKSAHTFLATCAQKDSAFTEYWADKIDNAKYERNNFTYPTPNGFFVNKEENCKYQRISPKINKKNIRYKIVYPDDDVSSDISVEWEFDRKTFHWVQEEHSLLYLNTERMGDKITILEQRLYDYIHPDILDTISFKYEEIKRGYDQQCAAEQIERDSLFRDSIVQLVAQQGGTWVENATQEIQKDTVFYMPEWKFPLLSGDSIYSDSIKSRFLLIDMWYISCHPCRMAMRELATIDTLYDESLLKLVSLNVFDKDTTKMRQVAESLNLKSDIACNYDSNYKNEMTKQMSGNECRGYPQLYLVDMETKQVIWYACGWYDGFTKDVGEIIMEGK